MENDILESIKANFQVGNITRGDADQLVELTSMLYHHICGHYKELREAEEMRPLLDGAMELPMDKYRIKIDQLEEEMAKVKEEKTEAENARLKLEEEIAKLEEANKDLRERLKTLEK